MKIFHRIYPEWVEGGIIQFGRELSEDFFYEAALCQAPFCVLEIHVCLSFDS